MAVCLFAFVKVNGGCTSCTIKHEGCASCCTQKISDILAKLFKICGNVERKMSKFASANNNVGGLAVINLQEKERALLLLQI